MATLLHVLYLGLFIFALSGCDASKSAQPSDTTADPSHSGNIDLGRTDLDLLVQLPSALSEETGGVTVERSLGADAADAARQAGLDVGMPAGGSVAALVSVTATSPCLNLEKSSSRFFVMSCLLNDPGILILSLHDDAPPD